MASALQNVDENKWTYKENATPSPTLVNVVVVLIPFRIPSRLERPHLHHCMHSQHGLSPRKGSKHVVLSIMQNHGRYSVLSLSAQIAIRSNVANQRIALGNGRCEPLLLPGVLLRNVLDPGKTEHRLPVLQVLAPQEVDRRTGVVVDEGRVVRHLVAVVPQIVERVRIDHLLHLIQ